MFELSNWKCVLLNGHHCSMTFFMVIWCNDFKCNQIVCSLSTTGLKHLCPVRREIFLHQILKEIFGKCCKIGVKKCGVKKVDPSDGRLKII